MKTVHLTKQQGPKTIIWALMIEDRKHNYVTPNCILIWGALDGKLSSRRLCMHLTQCLMTIQSKIQKNHYVNADQNAEVTEKVSEHLHKHLTWEQIAGIPAHYHQTKFQAG